MVVENSPKKNTDSHIQQGNDSSDEEAGSSSSNSKPQLNIKPDTELLTMPLGGTQIVSLKDAVEVVHKFDGTNIPVYQFIDSCEEALLMLPQNAEQNLVRLIRTKITGEAKRSIQGIKFENLTTLTTYLKELYCPAKTVNQARRELGTLVQKQNEDVIKYINRVREIGNQIIETIKSHNEGTVKDEEKLSTEQECIESFLDGLKPEIQVKMKSTYTTLTSAGADAIKIDRKQTAINELRKTQQADKPAPRRENVAVINKDAVACQICKRPGHIASVCWYRLATPSQDRDRGPAAYPNNKQQRTHTNSDKGSDPQEKFCRYCKKAGHLIDTCRKREFNNKQKNQENSNSLSKAGATRETPKTTNSAPQKTLVINQSTSGDELE